MHPPYTQIGILFHNEPPFLCCIYYNAIGDEHQNLSCLSVRQIRVCLTGIVGAAICRPRATYSRPYDILIKLPAKFQFV